MRHFRDQPLPIETLLRTIYAHDRHMYQSIMEGLDSTLEEYMSRLYLRPLKTCSRYEAHARTIFVEHFEKTASDQISSASVSDACKEIMQHTTLQTGPHVQLLLDRDFFSTALSSYIGLSSAGFRYFPIFTGSICKFETAKGEGAGYIKFEDKLVNIFGMSRAEMQKTSVIAAKKDFKFVFQGRENLPERVSFEFDRIANMAEGIVAKDATSCFWQLNKKLWNTWDRHQRVTPIYLDDRFYSRVLAHHLSDESSLLFRLLSDYGWINHVLGGMRRAAESPAASMFPSGTDFFWGVGDTRIHELRLKEGYLAKTLGKDVPTIKMHPVDLRKHLLKGSITPDVFMIFLVASFLPNFRVLGGPFQVAYLPLFKNILMESLNTIDPDQRDLKANLSSCNTSSWGMPVIEDHEETLNVVARFGSDNLIEKLADVYGKKSFFSVTRQMERFRAYPRWRNLSLAYQDAGATTIIY